MIKIKYLFFVVLMFLPISAFSVDLSTIDGIWRDTDQKESYYSISQDGGAIVLIDLKRLESTGDTLSAAYMGTLDSSSESFLLTPIVPSPVSPFDQIPIRIDFISDVEARISPECDVCVSPGGAIEKIFKFPKAL
ncbi:MAG: hypothetical protein KF888_05535 [Nitrosomonas sp.]|nr:hypothetical protein [Nitrosomonas sp.]